nr:immunoglobulin light chain junction region [Macaca mulatta]MOV74317.1 immunoglobulin light chain junction region [Macaca mulatta]MOV74325.1 immunoglobulin light chain junction region [Macaca mulatta]MOV74377.1 immunoglobulin light chain junction region [Macaca mulatta]MOV74469.1 immunoglobulin light chain junction region [Macaca mulatta]
CMQSVEFPLTF